MDYPEDDNTPVKIDSPDESGVTKRKQTSLITEDDLIGYDEHGVYQVEEDEGEAIVEPYPIESEYETRMFERMPERLKKFGVLFEVDKRTIQMIDENPIEIRKSNIVVNASPPRKLPQPPENYNGNIKFGDYIKFGYIEIVSGIIADYSSEDKVKLITDDGRVEEFEIGTTETSGDFSRKLNPNLGVDIVPVPSYYIEEPGKVRVADKIFDYDQTYKPRLEREGKYKGKVVIDTQEHLRKQREGDEDEDYFPGSEEFIIQEQQVPYRGFFRRLVQEQGVVIGFTSSSFVIMSDNLKKILVPFSREGSITIIPKKRQGRFTKMKGKTIQNEMNILQTKVTPGIRKDTLLRLWNIFSNLVPGVERKDIQIDQVKLTPEEEAIYNQGLSPFDEIKDLDGYFDQEKGYKIWEITWEFEGKEYKRKFMSSMNDPESEQQVTEEVNKFIEETYYRRELSRFLWSVFQQRNYNSAPDSLRIKAAEAQKEEKDINYIVERMKEDGPGSNFFTLEPLEMLEAFLEDRRQGKQIGYLPVAKVVAMLERFGREKLKTVSKRDIGLRISGIIKEYIQNNIPPLEEFHGAEIGKWLIEEFNKQPPNDDDVKTFDAQNLETIKQIYRENARLYDSAMSKIEENQRRFQEKVKEQRDEEERIQKKMKDIVGITTFPISLKGLSEKGLELCSSLIDFERFAYQTSFDGTKNYLGKINSICVYLEGPLADKLSFFKEKISGGDVNISTIYNTPFAFMIPELAMNFDKLSDEMWQTAQEIISLNVEEMTLSNINSYLYTLDPTRRIQNSVAMSNIPSITHYLTDISQRCNKDTHSGYEYVRDENGEVVYEKKNVSWIPGFPIWKMVPKRVKIPLKNLVICYNENTKKFSCLPKSQVFKAIKERQEGAKARNPALDMEFDDKFVQKMLRRYPNILETDYSQLKKFDPTEIHEPYDVTKERVRVEDSYPIDYQHLLNIIPENKLVVVRFCSDKITKCKGLEDEIWEELTRKHPDVMFYDTNTIRSGSLFHFFEVGTVPGFLVGRKVKSKTGFHQRQIQDLSNQLSKLNKEFENFEANHEKKLQSGKLTDEQRETELIKYETKKEEYQGEKLRIIEKIREEKQKTDYRFRLVTRPFSSVERLREVLLSQEK